MKNHKLYPKKCELYPKGGNNRIRYVMLKKIGAGQGRNEVNYVRRSSIYCVYTIFNQSYRNRSIVFPDWRITVWQKKDNPVLRRSLCGCVCSCMYLVCSGLDKLCTDGGIFHVCMLFHLCLLDGQKYDLSKNL